MSGPSFSLVGLSQFASLSEIPVSGMFLYRQKEYLADYQGITAFEPAARKITLSNKKTASPTGSIPPSPVPRWESLALQ